MTCNCSTFISTKHTVHPTTYTTARKPNVRGPKQTSSDDWWTCSEWLISPLAPELWSVWKIYIHYARRPPTLMRWTQRIAAPSRAGLRRTRCTRTCTLIYCEIKLCIHFFRNSHNFLHLFLLLWSFSWPFWASFTSHVRRDSLVRGEFSDPDAPSSAQAILRRTHPEIICAITLLRRTYSA